MDGTFEVTLARDSGYRFQADFHDGSGVTLQLDEPAPLGEGTGPNPARVLAGAVGGCLSASLLFCLERAHIDVRNVETRVTGAIERNEKGRLRVGSLKVHIRPIVGDVPPARIERCLGIFEDFCTVTASVRSGLEVEVKVDVTATPEGVPAEAGP